MTVPLRPGGGEPVVRNPVLRAMVDRARTATPPPLGLDAAQLRATWLERRAARRQWMAYAAAAAVLLAAAALAVGRAWPGPDASLSPRGTDTVASAPPVGSGPAQPRAPAPAVTAELSPAVTFQPSEPEQARFTIAGVWEVSVAAGVYTIGVDAAASSGLTVTTERRVLLVDPGGAVILEVGKDAYATLDAGTAAWVDADGRRAELRRVRSKTAAKPSPAALARHADALMSAGKTGEAIGALTRLVRKHPRTSAGKAALLDLARLLRTTGRGDRARCAYTMYLERWPSTPQRAEIDRALRNLGNGPSCRGLEPR